jgi:hypothetical protein
MSDDLVETLAVLLTVLNQVCWDDQQNAWNSVAVPAYANALRLLARHDVVKILTDDERFCVTAEPWQ